MKALNELESKVDAYQVFRKMLESGNPLDNWDELLKKVKGEITRLEKAI